MDTINPYSTRTTIHRHIEATHLIYFPTPKMGLLNQGWSNYNINLGLMDKTTCHWHHMPTFPSPYYYPPANINVIPFPGSNGFVESKTPYKESDCINDPGSKGLSLICTHYIKRPQTSSTESNFHHFKHHIYRINTNITALHTRYRQDRGGFLTMMHWLL